MSTPNVILTNAELRDLAISPEPKSPDARTASGAYVLSINEQTRMRLINKINGVGKLKSPLKIVYTTSSEGCEIECKDLKIKEYGSDFSDAFREFCIFFIEDFENLKEMPDSSLSEGALQLKEAYKKLAMS